MPREFTGNCPRNVSKDARYSVRVAKAPNTYEIGLVYRAQNDEQWKVVSDVHPELVEMVNAVKLKKTHTPGGSFYINEYQQVIVPVTGEDAYYYAGNYDKLLAFDFEGHRISGEPTDLAGNPLSPGDIWEGPHVGIPYVLCAGGQDIKYSRELRPNVTKEERLSRVIGPQAARGVAAQIREVKGFSGGRFYVNERRSIFAPMTDGWQVKYLYIGQLDLERWFPAPQIAEAALSS